MSSSTDTPLTFADYFSDYFTWRGAVQSYKNSFYDTMLSKTRQSHLEVALFDQLQHMQAADVRRPRFSRMFSTTLPSLRARPSCLPEQLRHQTVNLRHEGPTLALDPRRLVRLAHRRNMRTAAWCEAELLLDLSQLLRQRQFPGVGTGASGGRLFGRGAGFGS